MHHLGAAVPVRQIVGENLGVGERRGELLDAGGVRAVAAADEQRLPVEPERVAAVDRSRRLDAAGDRDAGLGEIVLERLRLAQPLVLARAQQHGAALADEQRVVRVDRVRVARARPPSTITSAPAPSRISRNASCSATAAARFGSARQPYSRQRTASAACGGRTSTRSSGWVIERDP